MARKFEFRIIGDAPAAFAAARGALVERGLTWQDTGDLAAVAEDEEGARIAVRLDGVGEGIPMLRLERAADGAGQGPIARVRAGSRYKKAVRAVEGQLVAGGFLTH
ncbi:hypothetical protein [Wenjunlia tyrosinilytica]|nr:hypothetical protein [Wenjunlia tyrosinilytica]